VSCSLYTVLDTVPVYLFWLFLSLFLSFLLLSMKKFLLSSLYHNHL